MRDTSKDHPLEKLMTAGLPGGIEAQEAQGQAELVRSTMLPTDGSAEIEGANIGIVYHQGKISDDGMFCEATLPEGWAKRPTGHSMWSEIIDETGAVRAKIFYKAAFYDRSAFIRLA